MMTAPRRLGVLHILRLKGVESSVPAKFRAKSLAAEGSGWSSVPPGRLAAAHARLPTQAADHSTLIEILLDARAAAR